MTNMISLLPDSVKQKQREKQKKAFYITCYSAVLVFMLMVFFVMSLAVANIHGDYNEAMSDRQVFKMQLSKLKVYEEKNKEVEKLEKSAAEIYGKAIDWEGLLVGISNSIPGGVWIDELTVSDEEDGKTVRIAGGAESYSLVSEWIDLLRQVQGITDLRLTQANQGGSDVKNAFLFEMSASLETLKTFSVQSEVNSP